MAFQLSQKSLSRLNGVKNEMHSVVCEAIKLSKIDFGVTCGLRTEAEQRELVNKGARQTMISLLLTGDAVDVVAYFGSRISWELNLYDDIADAFKEAALNNNVKLRWGAAWHQNLTDWEGSSEDLMNAYVDLRRSQGRRAFIDAPHFELVS